MGALTGSHAHIRHILSCNLFVMPLLDAIQVFQDTIFRRSLILNQFIVLFSDYESNTYSLRNQKIQKRIKRKIKQTSDLTTREDSCWYVGVYASRFPPHTVMSFSQRRAQTGPFLIICLCPTVPQCGSAHGSYLRLFGAVNFRLSEHMAVRNPPRGAPSW